MLRTGIETEETGRWAGEGLREERLGDWCRTGVVSVTGRGFGRSSSGWNERIRSRGLEAGESAVKELGTAGTGLEGIEKPNSILPYTGMFELFVKRSLVSMSVNQCKRIASH